MRKNSKCYGVDLNRNWGYHWQEDKSSLQDCSFIYGGPAAMSEVETRNLANFVRGIKDQVKLYISLHSFGQLIVWPEGYTSEKIPEYDDYERIAKAAVEAIGRRYGTKYIRGSLSEAVYSAPGTSTDYMRGVMKIPLSFCIELRPTRTSGSVDGFILEPKQIVPTGEETLDGLMAMVKEGKKLGYL